VVTRQCKSNADDRNTQSAFRHHRPVSFFLSQNMRGNAEQLAHFSASLFFPLNQQPHLEQSNGHFFEREL
jgi:hypothetical protein